MRFATFYFYLLATATACAAAVLPQPQLASNSPPSPLPSRKRMDNSTIPWNEGPWANFVKLPIFDRMRNASESDPTDGLLESVPGSHGTISPDEIAAYHACIANKTIDDALLGNTRMHDRRYIERSTDEPYRWGGRITILHEDGRVSDCSGMLIGERLVITARHCAMPDPERKKYHFQAAYFLGDSLDDAWAIDYAGQEHAPMTGCEARDDFMFLVLDRRIGEWLGFAEVRAIHPDQDGAHGWYDYGYPGDWGNGELPISNARFSVFNTYKDVCRNGGPWTADGTWAEGSSGTPVMSYDNSDGYRIGGVITKMDHDGRGVFALSHYLPTTVDDARRGWP